MKKFDDSAQLILIAGFTIGLAIVISTVMLNNIIFASNMASESSIDANRYYISNSKQMSSDALSGAYNFATQNQSPFNATLFDQYMSSYNEKVSAIYTIYGTSFNVKNSTFYDAYFTENGAFGGNPDWIVMANINTTDSFLIEINNMSILGNATSAFTVQAINNSGISVWSVKVYNESGNVNISVSNQTAVVEQTTSASGTLSMNITNDLIDYVDDFNFYLDKCTASEPYKLKFLNGTKATGYVSMSGTLIDGTSFSRVRQTMTNTTVSISSGKTRINVSIPISIP